MESKKVSRKNQKKKKKRTKEATTTEPPHQKEGHVQEEEGGPHALPRGGGEAEDAAESVDSGCIPDGTEDMADVTDWPQVEAVILEENKFISNILKWIPGAQPTDAPQETDGRKRKRDAVENTSNKRLRDVPVSGLEDLDELQEKYQNTLTDLRKNRKKKLWDPATKRKEAKLNKKLSRLQRRKDKRIKKKTHLKDTKHEQEIKNEMNFSENVKPKKPIYNWKGELVFSKFDFSSSTASLEKDSNVKSKDLKQLLSQALKEKEKVKRMEQKGDLASASKVVEQKAWSVALQKAEGVKVHSNPELLKKSIKRKVTAKKTSQKKWDQRKDYVDRKKAEKQGVRLKNIRTRKESKLNRKMKRMKKKGHVVPGF